MAAHHAQTITLARGRFGSTASLVLEHARARGVVMRDELVDAAGISPATVNRTVTAMVAAGLLRERPDRTRLGAVGRPSVPVEIDPREFVTIGIHLGRRVATVGIADLAGRVLAHRVEPRTPGADAAALEPLAVAAAELLGGLPGARPLTVGLVAPWRDLGLDAAPTGHHLQELIGLEVTTADHVAAVAATEFLRRRVDSEAVGATLYVYARDTVGFVVAVDRGSYTDISRVGSLTHYPAGSDQVCRCGHRGCLEATVSDAAVAQVGAELLGLAPASIRGVVLAATSGDAVAHGLLVHRARTLGRAVAVVHDMVLPDRVVLVGQGFTGYEAAIPDLRTAFEDAVSVPPAELRLTRFGDGIQAAAACTVGLGPVYDDPFGSVPRTTGVRRA